VTEYQLILQLLPGHMTSCRLWTRNVLLPYDNAPVHKTKKVQAAILYNSVSTPTYIFI